MSAMLFRACHEEIIAVLKEAITTLVEIDKLIERYGGWLNAFMTCHKSR